MDGENISYLLPCTAVQEKVRFPVLVPRVDDENVSYLSPCTAVQAKVRNEIHEKVGGALDDHVSPLSSSGVVTVGAVADPVSGPCELSEAPLAPLRFRGIASSLDRYSVKADIGGSFRLIRSAYRVFRNSAVAVSPTFAGGFPATDVSSATPMQRASMDDFLAQLDCLQAEEMFDTVCDGKVPSGVDLDPDTFEWIHANKDLARTVFTSSSFINEVLRRKFARCDFLSEVIERLCKLSHAQRVHCHPICASLEFKDDIAPALVALSGDVRFRLWKRLRRCEQGYTDWQVSV
jgi:hypothetical protein